MRKSLKKTDDFQQWTLIFRQLRILQKWSSFSDDSKKCFRELPVHRSLKYPERDNLSKAIILQKFNAFKEEIPDDKKVVAKVVYIV